MLERGRNKVLEIIILVIIGLIPILWFRGNFLIAGADINFPFDPAQEFLRRGQAWDSVYQGGRDNCTNFPTLIFYGIQTISFLITHSLQWTERLSFVFWFMLTGFSIYFLSTNVIFKDRGVLIRMSVCLFYIFNFCHLSCWAGVHIAAITAMAVLPVMFGLFIKILDGEKIFRNTILFSFFSIISGGLWVNPPTVVVFISIFIMYFLFRYAGLIGRRSWFALSKVINRCFILVALYILLNSYVLIPFISTLVKEGNVSSSLLKEYDVVKYINVQSAYSSPLNVLRLMGNPEFYHKWKGEYYYPFFEKYIIRRLFILWSFILPILAFMGVLLNSKDKNTKFFLTITVIGIILGMGPHSPMREVYPWLTFSIFTIFGYSILAGTGCLKLHEFIEKFIRGKKWFLWIPDIFIVCIIVPYLFFMHSFILGEMYTPKEKRKDLGSLHIKVPDYVFSSGEWMNTQEEGFTVAMLPEEMGNLYEWGYGAIDDVLAKISNKSVLYGGHKETVNIPPMVELYHLFVKALYNELTYKVDRLLNLMGIRYIIQRNDFRYYYCGDKDSPGFVKGKIKRQKGILYEKSFGEWDVYKNTNWQDDFIYPTSSFVWVQGENSDLLPVSELIGDVLPKNGVFLIDNDTPSGGLKDYCLKQEFRLIVNPRGGELEHWDGNSGILLYNHKNENILDKINRKIWINKSGEYYVIMKLKPRFQKLLLELGDRLSFSDYEILEWSYKPNEAEYKVGVSGDTLFVDCAFDGGGKEDEYVQIRNEKVNIDLEEYPFFIIDYILDSPEVQTIEFIFGLDFDGDKKIDANLRGFRTTDPAKGLKRYYLDVLNNAKNRFPYHKMYKVALIELYCHKIWGVDCSRREAKGNYRFLIKKIKFSNMKEKDINMKVINITDELKRIRISVPRIDLLKSSEIRVRYRFRDTSGVEVFEIFLRLSPRDGKGKEKLVFLDKLQVTNRYNDYRVDLMRYKDKLDLLKHYFLTGIEFKIGGKELDADISKIIKIENIKFFKSHFTNRWEEKNLKRPLLEIAKERIYLSGYKRGDVIPREIIISNILNLDKGWRRLRLGLDRDDFLQCQWICILPVLNYRGEKPVLSYRKINETLYTVDVKGVNSPFILIMKNNYDKGWKAYKVEHAKWSEFKGHFMANGFANAWFVRGVNGDTEIIIKYKAQDLFRLGLGVSIITLVGLLLLVIKSVTK